MLIISAPREGSGGGIGVSRRVVLGKWGANVALRLPRDIASEAGFANGTSVEIVARRGEVVIRAAQPCYRLNDLLRGMTPEAMREAFDWGPDRGREAVE
jgi:antitoxin MazE